jgi:hypothetical protein
MMMHLSRSASELTTVSSIIILLISSTHDFITGNQTAPLADKRAWAILEQFLTTDMSYVQMKKALSSYLGNQYLPDDWKEARDALCSGDSDEDLTNLRVVMAKHIHPVSAPNDSSLAKRRSSSTRVQSSRRPAKVSKNNMIPIPSFSKQPR